MTTWHASEDVLAAYADDPTRVDDTVASSLEVHLVECERCRSAIASASPSTLLERSWETIADRIDARPPRLVERLLRVAGVEGGFARLVMATPGLRLSWIGALALVVAGVVWMSTQIDDPGPFLVLAPVAPLAAVTAVFLPGREPAGEAAAPTPLAGLGLALRRTVAVLVPSVAIVAVGSLAVPGVGPVDIAWLLPALCLCSATIAAATWFRADLVGGALSFAWVAAVLGAGIRTDAPTRELAPFSPAGQAVCLALAVVAIVVITVRRDAFAVARRAQ